MNFINETIGECHLWKVKIWIEDTKTTHYLVASTLQEIEGYVNNHFGDEGACVFSVKWVQNMTESILQEGK